MLPRALAGAILNPQVSVGTTSCQLLGELASTPEGLVVVLEPTTTAALLAMADDPTIMVRVLAELYIGIIRASPVRSVLEDFP